MGEDAHTEARKRRCTPARRYCLILSLPRLPGPVSSRCVVVIRLLSLTLVALLCTPLAAQPLPDGVAPATPARTLSGTHFYGELLGASLLGLSLSSPIYLSAP